MPERGEAAEPTEAAKGSKECIELVVLSREAAERYEPRGKEICISIGDPRGEPAQLSDAFVAVLRLAFNDITAFPGPEDVLFAEEHAEEVLRFAEHWPDVDRIVIHCHAGVSRSPGAALGLCDVLGWPVAELERDFPSWNRRVRRVIADLRVRAGASPGARGTSRDRPAARP